jgi:type II secretory pathway pseudopilin PulG
MEARLAIGVLIILAANIAIAYYGASYQKKCLQQQKQFYNQCQQQLQHMDMRLEKNKQMLDSLLLPKLKFYYSLSK